VRQLGLLGEADSRRVLATLGELVATSGAQRGVVEQRLVGLGISQAWQCHETTVRHPAMRACLCAR
jgi:hypothetical protein